MISENDLWKEYLNRTAKKLSLRMVQKKWSRRSIFNLEKELFVGFFSVRKLIESNAAPKELLNKKYKSLHFPRKYFSEVEIDNEISYKPPKGFFKEITVRDICNQFIHSYHMHRFCVNNYLIGFFINSDFQNKIGIYLITIFDIVEIYKLCSAKKD